MKASAHLDKVQSGIMQIAIGIGNLPLDSTTGTAGALAVSLMDQAKALSDEVLLIKVLLQNGSRDFEVPDRSEPQE